MKFERLVLEGKLVKLEPLDKSHQAGIEKAVSDGKLWELFYAFIPSANEIEELIEKADKEFKQSNGLAYAIIDNKTNNIAGYTQFIGANIMHKTVEIGRTVLGKSFQGKALNTEAKLLMLTYAFEDLDINRVQLLCDCLNFKSRNSILKLGAKQEGILRNNMIMPNGRIRDSILFSIIKGEWPGIKQNLEHQLSDY